VNPEVPVQLQLLSYTPAEGWSIPLPSHLDSTSTFLVAFGSSSIGDDPAPFRALAEAFPRVVDLAGGRAAEPHRARVADDTISVAIAAFERTPLRAAYAPIECAAESLAAGQAIARQLAAPDLRGVFILSDGRAVNGSELVRGVNGELARNVVVTGGLAGDGDRFQRTWVLVDGAPRAGFIAAVGLYGDAVHIGHGSKGGWDLFGPERMVTRSEGNVLYELDGRPALQLYKEYLGERVSGLPATALLFPLAIRDPGGENQLVRTILAIDEQHQSMVFAGDVPRGSHAQLMRANFERLVQGASDAALMTGAADRTGDLLSIAISCVGRRLVLRQRTDEELEAALEIMPAGTRQVGFYSYGELSPLADGSCELHNQTMTLTTFCES
jgi:hypothetical protein